MGLFSSSYKYYAYAGSSYLFPGEDREHTVKSLLLQAGITGQSSMAEAITIGLQTDLYRRAMKMAKYAAKEGGYPYGFPSTNQFVYNITNTMLRPYIEADAGGAIDFRTTNWHEWTVLESQQFFTEAMINENYLNATYFPWPAGDPDDTNWSPADDSVEIPVQTDPPGDYEESNNQFDLIKTGNSFQVSFPYSGGSWNVAQPFDMSPFAVEGTWIQVRYRMSGGGDQYLYWYYLIGSNAIPALEAQIEKEQFETEYLPIAVLMHDRIWFDEQDNLVLEEGLDRLLKYLALDPWTIKEEFIDSIENPDPETPPEQIPNIEDVWDFFVQFSMPLRTRDRAGREYLWRYYKYLATRSWTTFDDYNTWVASPFSEQPFSELLVQEGEEYTGYIARYGWSYVSEASFDGEFTPPGWTRPLKTRECWSEEYALGDPDYAFGLDLVHGVGNYNVAASQPDGQEHTYSVVVRQNPLSESVDGLTQTYTAVLIMGPSMEYQINTSDVPVGVGAGGYVDYRYRFVDVEIFPEDPEQDSEFRWPIHVGTLKAMSAMRREPALQEALAATVFLVDEVKVKWYQKTFFKWLIIIIVIILVVLTYQYQWLGTLSSMASAAFAAGATGTAIALAALYVAYVFALGFLISFAGNLIGGTWGKIFMILATIYLAGGTSFLNNIGNQWGNMVSNFGWGNAVKFLQSIRPILDIGQLIIEDRALAKLESDMRDFTKTAREKYEELEDAWDELGDKPSWLDPLDLVGAFQAQWYVEKPENYYERTLNANPGLIGYDMVNRFAELALVLPQDGNPGDFVKAMLTDMERQRGAA